MKRIFLVDEHQVVGYPGGIERVLCDLANAFAERGYDIFLVCMNAEEGRPLFPLSEHVHFVNLSLRDGGNPFRATQWQLRRVAREVLRGLGGKDLMICGHRFNDPKLAYRFHHFATRLRRLITENPPDLFFAITPATVRIIRAALDGRDIPILGMFHSHVSELQYFTEEDWEVWRSCACIQVLQPSFEALVRAHGIENVVTIPNAVPAVAEEQRCHLENVRHRIITVGRLEGSGKRQHLLVEAFAKLADKFPDWQVDIYGNADSRRYVKRLEKQIADLGLASSIHLRGVTDDLPSAYRASDIFAFPSRNEGFGLAVMEAMSYGLPVLAFQECYGDDYIVSDSETGFRCDSVEAFAEKLELLMEHQELRISLGRAAYQRSKAFFADAIWTQWEHTLEPLMK